MKKYTLSAVDGQVNVITSITDVPENWTGNYAVGSETAANTLDLILMNIPKSVSSWNKLPTEVREKLSAKLVPFNKYMVTEVSDSDSRSKEFTVEEFKSFAQMPYPEKSKVSGKRFVEIHALLGTEYSIFKNEYEAVYGVDNPKWSNHNQQFKMLTRVLSAVPVVAQVKEVGNA